MSHPFRRVAAATLAGIGLASTAALAGVAGLPLAQAAVTGVVTQADFNADGYADIAVGVPGEDLGTLTDAGSVQVFLGGPTRVEPSSAQTFNQNSSGVLDTAEAGDRFGSAIALGDFDGDGFSDLAIGVPYEDVGPTTDAGAVQVLYGSSSGLSATGNQFLSQDFTGTANSEESGDRFGTALAAGNVAGSSQADLAVGVPRENVGSLSDAGGVHVLRGSATGLTTAGDQFVTQNSSGAADRSESGDLFGSALAIADFGGSSQADLAVGVPYENVGTTSNAGAVQIFPGASTGVNTSGDKYVSQNSPGAADRSEAGDHFGAALAAADMAGSTRADLAVGVPLENVGSVSDAGAIQLLRGSTSGVTTTSDQLISQNTSGAADTAERNDHFGAALAAGRVAGGGKADLVVGVPEENIAAKTDAGAIQVLRGATSGLTTAADQVVHQSSRGSDAAAETNDHFGAALSVANVVGSSTADVLVGIPNENVGTAADGGTIQIFRGTTDSLTVSGDQVIGQGEATDSFAEDGDRFGTAVAAN